MKKYEITWRDRFRWWLRFRWRKIFIPTIYIGSTVNLEWGTGTIKKRVKIESFLITIDSNTIGIDCRKLIQEFPKQKEG